MYQSRKGVWLKDGFYLAQNAQTKKVNVISVAKNMVYLHDIARKLSLDELTRLDKTGYLDVFAALEMIDPQKKK